MTIAVQSGLPTKRCTIALPLTMHRTVARCGTSWPEPVPHAHDTRSSVMAVGHLSAATPPEAESFPSRSPFC